MKTKLMPLLIIILSITAASLIVFIVFSAISSPTIHCTGTVKAVGVGVFWDANCTNTTASINWGTLEPGENKTVTLYIKNTSNVPVNVTMVTENWQPSNTSDYIFLTWDCEGKHLAVDEVTPAILTLSVSPDIHGITSFSFDIRIIGEG